MRYFGQQEKQSECGVRERGKCRVRVRKIQSESWSEEKYRVRVRVGVRKMQGVLHAGWHGVFVDFFYKPGGVEAVAHFYAGVLVGVA